MLYFDQNEREKPKNVKTKTVRSAKRRDHD